MNNSPTSCREELLRWVLDEPEQSGRYQAAAEHVQSCPKCQRRLAELAADEHDWLETHELLSEDPTVESLDREWRQRSASGHGPTHDSQASAISEAMIRQYLDAPSHPEMLGRLGRYEIERWIGAGGMGIVLKGFDTELNRPVAIKLLAPHLAANGAARQRFAREARAAAAVVHEHVVAIHNVESDAALPLLVMQYVAGESLQTRLDHGGALDVTELLRIAHQTALGLAAAHAQGLVHRDVKPSNILLEKGVERALLTDFGLARASDDASLTHTGYLPGTPHYMSPEQARGEAIDARSDLFSLGSVMYAMATGRPPFRADTSFGVLRRITDTQPRPVREINPQIPDWLAALVDRLLEKNPKDRCEAAGPLATLLAGCLAHVQQPAVVRLPAEVQKYRDAWLRQSADDSQEAVKRAAHIRSRRLWLAGAATLTVIAVVVVWMTLPPGLVDHQQTGQQRQSSSSISNAAADSSSQSTPVLAWDAQEVDLLEFQRATTDLVESYAPLWLIEPAKEVSSEENP